MGELIDKTTVVAEIEGYISNYKDIVAKTDAKLVHQWHKTWSMDGITPSRNDSSWVDFVSMIDAKIDVLQHLLSFLNTLEVKEVDLEKEIKSWLDRGHITDTRYDDYDDNDIESTAKHFFELGLKAQKGE